MAIEGNKKSSRRKLKKTKSVQLLTGSNLSILILGIASVIFIASIIDRHMRGGMTIQDFSTAVQNPSPLGTINDESLLTDIEAEVLNGCGVSGVAQKITDYFRQNHIDVVRTENADNFNYDKTIAILRRGDFEQVREIARLLEISPSDSIRVIEDRNESLRTDVTIIIGSDYLNIGPIQRFLKTQL